MNDQPMTTPQTRPPAAAVDPGGRFSHAAVDPLILRAQAGDPTVHDEARDLFWAAPDADRRAMSEWFAGNARRSAECALVERHVPGDATAQLATRYKMAAIRKDLEGENPTAVERLLAERAAMCWLLVYSLENSLACGFNTLTLRQLEFRGRMADRAHRQYVGTLKALAAVRRGPAAATQINVNVEGNTLNVGATPAAERPPAPSTMDLLGVRVSPRN